jgi:hypothetical protein
MNPSLSSKISKVAAIIPAPEAEKSALQCLHDDLIQIEHVVLINSVFFFTIIFHKINLTGYQAASQALL